MLTGIFDGLDLALNTARTKAARYQDTADITGSSPTFSTVTVSESIHLMLTLARFATPPCLRILLRRCIGIVQLDILADQSHGDLFPGASGIDHGAPFCQIRFGHGRFKHWQATSARCPLPWQAVLRREPLHPGSGVHGSSEHYRRAILLRRLSSNGCSLRHTEYPTQIPIACRSFTLAWVGLVFNSPDAFK